MRFLRHFGASKIALSKARLLNHDFPVHGSHLNISISTSRIPHNKGPCCVARLKFSFSTESSIILFMLENVNPGGQSSASPKPDPSKPHPCNMPPAKTEVALQFPECCAAETALQHWLFCSAEAILTKSCAAANEKLHCNIAKAALQESGVFLPLSCGFQAPTFRHPRLGPAEILKLFNLRALQVFLGFYTKGRRKEKSSRFRQDTTNAHEFYMLVSPVSRKSPWINSGFKKVKLESNADNSGREFWAWILGVAWNPGKTRPKNSPSKFAIKIRWEIRRQFS